MTRIFDAADVCDWIANALESNADWRQRKAEEYPDDERNQEAAAHSLKLRGEVLALPAAAFAGIVTRVNSGDDAYQSWCEFEAEEIKDIGFRSFPESGGKLIQSLGGSDLRLVD